MTPHSTTYDSKKDLWLGLLIFGALLGSLLPAILSGHWPAFLIMLLISILVGILWFGTRYIVTEERLKVMLGPITYDNIALTDITDIEKTNTWISSPACSLDRIRINYGKYGSVVISPKDKEAFVRKLKMFSHHNPAGTIT